MPSIADKVFEHNSYNAYRALTAEADKLITDAVANLNPPVNLTSRTKTIASINEKIARENYQDFQNEMKDIAGIRITCMMKRQKEEAIQILKNNFDLIEHKATDSNPYKMGYADDKLILKLGNRFLAPEYDPIRELPFEVQIRFIFMDAWAKFSHAFAYKEEANIPPELLRKIQIMSAACEMLDGLADDYANSIEARVAEVVDEIKSASKTELDRIPINMESLQAYLELNFPGKPIDRRTQSSILKDIDRARYKTIADIDRAIADAAKFTDWYAVKSPTIFASGADYVTKALGWTDPEFRQKHPFGRPTREAFRQFATMTGERKLSGDPRPTREVQKALHGLFTEGVRQMNRLIPTIKDYDDVGERLTLRKWQEQVLDKLEEARVSVPVMSRFETFHKFAPEFHVAEGKSDHQKLLEGIWNEKLKRLRAIIDSFEVDA